MVKRLFDKVVGTLRMALTAVLMSRLARQE